MAVKFTQKNGQIDLTKKMFKGDTGGYYVPNVDEEGNLTWVASEEDMPSVEGANIRGVNGERGDSGVYIGTEEPNEDVNVWINPDGDISVELATKEYVNETVANVSGNVDLSDYYTKEEVNNLLANIEPTEQLPVSEEGEF